jgi:hypothetical protein
MSDKAQTKISAAQAKLVYAEVPAVLNKLASERDTLQEKLAAAETELARYRTEEKIGKIAMTMQEKGINRGLSFGEQVEQVKEAHTKGKSLDAIEQAVEMTMPSGEIMKIAEGQTGNGATDLEQYLLGELA